jgi:hypothetical protein
MRPREVGEAEQRWQEWDNRAKPRERDSNNGENFDRVNRTESRKLGVNSMIYLLQDSPIYIIMISIDHWLANTIDNERECKFWEYIFLLNNRLSPSFFHLETVLPAVLLHSPMTVCVHHGTVFMAVACSCPFLYVLFFVVGWIRGGVMIRGTRVVIGRSGLADLLPYTPSQLFSDAFKGNTWQDIYFFQLHAFPHQFEEKECLSISFLFCCVDLAICHIKLIYCFSSTVYSWQMPLKVTSFNWGMVLGWMLCTIVYCFGVHA